MCITLKLLLLSYIFIHVNTLDCKDQENNDVEWFMVYKIPVLKDNGKFIKDGFAYIYMTSKNTSWTFSDISVNNTNSIIGNTLANLYKKQEKLSYILYNDEPPNGKTSSTNGHTKGVVATDDTGGFWLIHSVPHFPDITDHYTYPRTGTRYGQTLLCISMDLENLDQVGLQLQYNEPNIYSQNILSNVKAYVPNLAKAAANVTIKIAPWFNVANLKSKGGVEFLSFAKSNKFNKELYVDLIAPYLESDLQVETWPNGSGRLRSNCTQRFKVNNVKSIEMSIANVTFTSTEDHSKWAVTSVKSQKFWSCIGDINREEHQKVRGGGTVCLNNKIITNAFQNLVKTFENC